MKFEDESNICFVYFRIAGMPRKGNPASSASEKDLIDKLCNQVSISLYSASNIVGSEFYVCMCLCSYENKSLV